MGVNVVTYGGKTLVDMRNATATAETVLAGYTAYGADGDLIIGTLMPTVHKTISVTLYKNRWTDNQQTVDVDFVTAEAMVIAGGKPGDQEYFGCGVWCSGQEDGRLIFSCTYEPMEDVIANIGVLMTGENGETGEIVISYATGSTITLTDSANRKIQGLTLYGKTVQNGTPTPNAPVELETVGNSGSITVKIGTSEADTNPQILTVQTPNGLPGIPVSSGGYYTDENGQMWVCDEIDFARGKYVQRIKTLVLNGSETWGYNSTMNAPFLVEAPGIADCTGTEIKLLCDNYQPVPISASWRAYDTMVSRASETLAQLYFRNVNYTTIDAFKASLADSPIKVQYILAEPIETDLTTEEIAQYSALHTYKPNTTIYTNSGAGILIRYVKE